MSKFITVNLPCNITDNDRHLFEPHTRFQWDDLRILHLQEIFVTYSGLCLDENGLKEESHHAYPEKYQQLVHEAAYYYTEASNDSNNLVELDDENEYLLIYHPWSSNYWHWMSEAILRLWLVKETTRNLVLLLPEHFKSIEFINSSLMPFEFKNIYYIPTNKSLLVRNLCLPQIKPICDSYDHKALQEIRMHYFAHEKSAKTKDVNLGDKVYISRSKAYRRRVVNEEEVISVLKDFGFICVTTEDYNFHEEINLFSHVRYLISIHGSGLTNMLFMKEKSSVLELHKKRTNAGDWHSFAFWYLADALGFDYYHQLCEPTNPKSSIFDANYLVDISLLQKNVKHMLEAEVR